MEVQLVLQQPLERREYLREALEKLLLEGLALDVLDEHILGEFLYAFLHLRFDRQLEVVLRKGSNHVEVVVGN